ncbi:hypothetical protein QTI33_18755 [Variovorax sp. J22P271]|uniref:hypothetical protein n=1 Tax=Variovorax davisae TaxID=3053515 RepID=UPI0025783F73|nr:hypothetical protein [Variovorax sp. J22P271]MDM0034181.1 hypothetical protein [Variovorax sp. J22P271]
MKRFASALAMTAALAGGSTTSLAFNGNGVQGGSPGGLNRALRTVPGLGLGRVAVPVLWYCQNPIGYFPTIQACPAGWIQVTRISRPA